MLDISEIMKKDVGLYGMDVHKKTITIARADDTGEQVIATIPNNPQKIEKFFSKAQKKTPEVHTVYEAGGCGFVLARQLKVMGIKNVVAAPSKIEKASGDHVKNDKRDARKLASLLRRHVVLKEKDAIHEVVVPDEEDEAIRDLTRQRKAFKDDAKKTQVRIKALLLRNGFYYTETATTWTQTYRQWLETLDFGNPHSQKAFHNYLDMLAMQEKAVKDCDDDLKRLCEDWNKGALVKALMALKGIQFLSAMILVAEIGDFSRFDSPARLMAYLGLTPSEYSSGDRTTRSSISKAGNTRVRTLLIEAAMSARFRPKSRSAFLATCPKGLPPEVLEHAYKGQRRLASKFARLIRAGKNSNVARVAVARELVGFVWAIALMIESAQSLKPAV